jgi:hypothetical protein
MHIHSPEELTLFKSIAEIFGIEIMSEMSCYIDPECGSIDKNSSEDQNKNKPFNADWNFKYPVYIPEKNCICNEPELLKNLEEKWDDEKQVFARQLPRPKPAMPQGHSPLNIVTAFLI